MTSLVDQLESVVDEVIGLRDRLAQTAEDLRLAHSLHPQGVVAELAESRKTMSDISARLVEMERFLSPAAEAPSEPIEQAPPAIDPAGAISLRPARPSEDARGIPPAGVSLGRKWEEADARLSGLSQFIERALRATSASDAAMNLGNLALEYHQQKKFDEAERLYLHALAFREKFFGPDHSSVATGLNNLAMLLQDQGRYEEASKLLHRSLAIAERTWGPDHPKVVRRLANLAALALKQERVSEAKYLFERILAIGEKHRQTVHPEVTASLRKYADTLEKTGHVVASAELTTRLRALESSLAPESENF